MILARVFDNCNQGHDLLQRDSLQREGNELPPLENVGGCGLQVLYGAFKTAFQAMYWWLDKILKAMWNLFHDSPARRETYIRVS